MRIYEDLRVVQARLAILQGLAVVLVALLVVQFWSLQVLRARHFRGLAENNRSRVVTLAAPRGTLLDREGQVLVGNRPSFNVLLSPEHAPDLDRVVARLAATLGVGEATIRERLARRQPYRPVVVKTDATLEDVAALDVRRRELPEVTVEVVPLRSYPLASAAAHALGRVGEISERQLQLPEFKGLAQGSLVGQAGIESRYNRELMGKDGFRRVVVNSRGLEVTEASRQPPEDGPNLTLSIDASLQAAVEMAFEGRAGSAVALDPRTGEILAMASTPAYDPNEFTTGIDPTLWASLATDPRTPLMNRVIQGAYSPGSTFKVISATAALEEGVITPATTFYCPGYLNVYNATFHCRGGRGHGLMDLRGAIANSCNVYFYQVGIRLEIGRLAKWAKLMGLGAPTGVDLPHEASGLMPSPEWKMRLFKTPWYAGETVSVAIGQGQVSATPLQMARVAAVIASGGDLVSPHLVKAAAGGPRATPPQPLGIRPETIAAVKEGMCSVVAEGTGWRARMQTVAVCGKTGSAQVVSSSRLEKSPNAFEMQPHGWFLAFAPAENPTIALSVLVEHGRSGGESAAPVARQILAHYFGLDRPAAPGVAGMADAEAEDYVPVGIDRRLVHNIDWVLLGATLTLALVGVAMVYSATHTGRHPDLYLKQLVLVGLGTLGLVVASTVDYRRLADRAVLLYALSVVALLYVLFFGPVIAQTRRWVVVGGFQLQPSELVKLAAAVFVAKVFSEYRQETLGLRDVVLPGAAVGLLALLIARQPDLGTAACLVPLFLAVAFLAGLRMRAVLGLAAVLLLTAALAWPFLKDYQRTRIYTFLDPSLDPRGAGYQKIQSQIAVGSGGLLGRGFLEGSQAQLGYLPARHTDFIFSVLAEEAGFLGVVVALALYLLVLWRMLETARLARDRLGAFLVAGIAGSFAFQVVYNVAMVAGLVPVKGLPLPLMSYGGSSILSSLLGMGLVLSVRMRRFAN